MLKLIGCGTVLPRNISTSRHCPDDELMLELFWVQFESLNCCFISPDSVRLVNGTSLCSGRLEVKTNQSNQSNQSWSSVCEADFDQQDAEVVCRQLGCGAPSVLQGVIYGEVEDPMWTKEFQCGGNESALLDCRSSDSERNTCSPGKAVGLTCSGRRGAAALIWFISVLMKLTLFFYWRLSCFCSEPDDVRLVGGDSRCAGTLELKHQGDWRPVGDLWLWLDPEDSSCCLQRVRLWLCCFCRTEIGVLSQICVVDQLWLCSAWICSEGVCNIIVPLNYILNLTCSGKPISEIIYNIIYDSNVSSMFLPPSQWQSLVSIGLNCKVIQDNDILKCRELYDELF